jgi:type II restriction enzyme
VTSRSKHFKIIPAFEQASYLVRYRELCKRLVLEKHYSAAALITAPKATPGDYAEPLPDIGIAPFFRALRAHLIAQRAR